MRILVSLLMLPVSIAIRGVILKAFWGWFVLPVFGLSPLGIMQAVGLAAALTAFAADTHTPFRVEAIAKRMGLGDPDPIEGAVRAVPLPLFMLAIGWVVHLFL